MLYQYWIASYNLERLVMFVRNYQGTLRVFDLDKLKLNHRKRTAFCFNLVAISVCFLYSLVQASSYLLFPKTGLPKSYLLTKSAIILVIGILIWSAFTYKFYSSIKSINNSIEELTLELKSNDILQEKTKLAHASFVILLFFMFIASTVGDFIKSYESLNTDLNKAKVVELGSFDIIATGHFIVLSTLLVLFHKQNTE